MKLLCFPPHSRTLPRDPQGSGSQSMRKNERGLFVVEIKGIIDAGVLHSQHRESPQAFFFASRLDGLQIWWLVFRHDWGDWCVVETPYENEHLFFPVLPVVAGFRITASGRLFSFRLTRRATGHHLRSRGEVQ